jgi:hypothetical protein
MGEITTEGHRGRSQGEYPLNGCVEMGKDCGDADSSAAFGVGMTRCFFWVPDYQSVLP